MIEPALSDEKFLADVEASRQDSTDTLRLWWLGQSGFLMQHRGGHVLCDPYLSDSLTKKYAGTAKPHVRMTRQVIAAEHLRFVNVITSTHNHTDHLDAETLLPLIENQKAMLPRIVLPAANEAFAIDRLGLKGSDAELFVKMTAGVWEWVEGFQFYAVPAAHDQLTTDDRGLHLYLGFVVKASPWTIYHSGDTIVYDGMVDLLEPLNIDVAILPINGKVGNMNGADAARLAKDIHAKLVVPCHYEMFEFNTADPREQFIPECERVGQAYRVLQAGERLTLDGDWK